MASRIYSSEVNFTKNYTLLYNMDVVKLQEDLSRLIRWYEEWQMLFNVGKCKVSTLGIANCRDNTSWEIRSWKWFIKKKIWEL